MINIPAESNRLILVEDDKELASLIQDYLIKKGFQVTVIRNGSEAAEAIPELQPDIVILDIMLPGITGMEVCKIVRPQYAGPIIMLTALDEDMDQMLGLELGADDYIIKPVQPRLLLTRIHALLRRVNNNWSAPHSLPVTSNNNAETSIETNRLNIQVDSLLVDLSNRSAHLDGRHIDLTTAEFELLALLAHEAGKVVDRDIIVQRLRGFDYDGLDRSIDRRISRLRKKLQGDNDDLVIIKTIRGKGYQLCLQFTPYS